MGMCSHVSCSVRDNRFSYTQEQAVDINVKSVLKKQIAQSGC